MGFATRRGADALIESGKVFVNGKRAIIGAQIQEGDRVEIRKAPVVHYRYILYYKPRGVITHSPEAHETDILSRIKKDHRVEGVFPVGRLDKDSEGLIILTDDGRITERLLSPREEHEKEYEVTIDKKVTSGFLRNMSAGVKIERYQTKPTKALAHPKNDHMFTITLTEGKKHQVRRMCAALGCQVKSLKRTRIMNFTLRKLHPGQMHELKQNEVKAFQEALGLRQET